MAFYGIIYPREKGKIMAKREWIGNYKLHYAIYYSYKDEWVQRQADLGKCLSRAEATDKAVAFMMNADEVIKPLYLSDGFGNKFAA